MSVQCVKLCSVILLQHFGETVQTVGECLATAVQSRTLGTVVKTTGLSRAQCVQSLAVLLKFHLATVQPSRNGLCAEYALRIESVLLVLRYPRYVHLVQSRTRTGEMGAALVEELLRSGSQTATRLLARCCDDTAKYPAFEGALLELVQANYVLRAPRLIEVQSDGAAADAATADRLMPKFVSEPNLLYVPPKLSAIEWEKLRQNDDFETSDKDIFWQVNTDRFHQDFRDGLIISAMERKYDANAGECMRYILQQMYVGTEPWMIYSNPISLVDIRHLVEARVPNTDAAKYLEQYVNIFHDDRCDDETMRILTKYGDMGGGQYVIEMKKIIDQLTWICIEHIITEKFGSKAARIFRVVRQKKYAEQEEIQKEAMIPAKELKHYTYLLLKEHFLQEKPIRKPGGGGTGMAKSFYLFYVNQQQIVQMLLEISYKALFNSMIRSAYDKSENRRLIEKSQRVESIVEAMKERGETDEYIAEIYETLTPPERDVLLKVKLRIKSLYSAEIGLDETIFLLQLFMKYRQSTVK